MASDHSDYPEFRRPNAEMIRNSESSEFGVNLREQALRASLTPTVINAFKIVPHFDTDGYVLTLGGLMMVEINDPGSGHGAAHVAFPWSFYLPKNVASSLVRLLGDAIEADAARPERGQDDLPEDDR